MQITFLQSGGFAGAIRGVRLDTAALPAGDREEVERLVAACGLEGSCERFTEGGRDRRQYDLAIDRDGRTDRLSCDDGCLPEAARPLVAFLAARATPQGAEFAMPAASRGAASDQDWGHFEGQVVARWEDDGRTMTLVEPFAYVDPREARWPAPAGAVVNGASIPRAFWSLVGGPFSGEFRDASVVHDVACETRDRPWQAVHRMFYEACRCGGVGAVMAKTMYYAVFHYGPRWQIEERTTIVAGERQTARVVRDETPAAATEAEVAAIARYFAIHEVAADDIPTLEIDSPEQ
jgi:hypothetical protein